MEMGLVPKHGDHIAAQSAGRTPNAHPKVLLIESNTPWLDSIVNPVNLFDISTINHNEP